jgi:hypothetical protein
MYMCTKWEIVVGLFLDTNCEAKCSLASFQGDLKVFQKFIHYFRSAPNSHPSNILDDDKWHCKILENKEMGPLQLHTFWRLSNLSVQFMILHIHITTPGILQVYSETVLCRHREGWMKGYLSQAVQHFHFRSSNLMKARILDSTGAVIKTSYLNLCITVQFYLSFLVKSLTYVTSYMHI